MNFLITSFIAVLIPIGVIAAYFDIKKGIIPNKLILFGYVAVFLLYFFLFFYNVFYLNSLSLQNYLPAAFINGIISLLVGFLIWNFGFWSAGDGKLFGLYAFLLPLNFYSSTYLDYFPSFVLLVNLFFPLLLFIFFKFLIYIFRKNRIFRIIKQSKFWKKNKLISIGSNFLDIYTLLLFVVIFLNYLIKLNNEFIFQINDILVFIIALFILYILKSITNKYSKFAFIKYLTVLIYFGYLFSKENYTKILDYLSIALFFMIVIVLFKKVLLFYIERQEMKKVKAKDIKEGMILSKGWRDFFSEEIAKLTNGDKDKYFNNMRAEGLTKEQAKIIRETFKDDPKYNVAVCNSLNFAPFLLLSATISLLTSSSFLVIINKMMQLINI